MPTYTVLVVPTGLVASGTASVQDHCSDIVCALYSLLSSYQPLAALVADQITPDVPTLNTQLPCVLFNVSNSSPVYHLKGMTRPTEYAVSIDSWAKTMAEVVAVMKTVRAAMGQTPNADILGAFVLSEQTNPEEEGFHGQQSFSAWF